MPYTRLQTAHAAYESHKIKQRSQKYRVCDNCPSSFRRMEIERYWLFIICRLEPQEFETLVP
jgi:hypothetical protein